MPITKHCLAATGILCLISLFQPVKAQTTSVLGIITDHATGRPLEGANIALQKLADVDGNMKGVAAGQNGFYQISNLEPGSYTLRVSYIGYVTHEDTIALVPGERRSISIALEPDEELMDEVIVIPAETGAAGLTSGRQRLESVELGRVPTPAGAGDLASYLQTLPGVVSTGDRGGQLYIRGGTPAENMVLVDGIMIFQPFHILGYFSAFPENLVSNADIYAGGFGARYNGRTSSVVDIKMRSGDRYNTSGSASVSPFLLEVVAEGPLSEGRSSWIAAVRRSAIEESSPLFLGEKYPLRFESQFLKMTHFGESDSRCSALVMRTYDRGRLDVKQNDFVKWNNVVLGGQCVVLPEGTDMLLDINAGFSSVSNQTGNIGDPELTSSARRFNLDVNLTRYFGRIQFNYGAFVHIHSLQYDMTELFGGPQISSEHLLSTGTYMETILPVGNLEISPGAAFSFHKEVYAPSLEPRLRASWQPLGREDEQFSAAVGLYRQPLTGITGTSDAGSVFTAWMTSPVGDSQMQAVHAIFGWRQLLGPGLQVSVEGYKKWLRHLTVPVWSTQVQFTTEMSGASGSVLGGDFRLELNRGPIYGFIGYGISHTEYETAQDHFDEWFGQVSKHYHPPHDRRHQFNSMLNIDFGRYSAGVRWELGSGLPFTRPLGFDETFSFRDGVPLVKEQFGSPRVLLEDLYQGRMTTYHRLDVSLKRSITFPFGELKLQIGAINMYNQTNMFYYDVYTHRQVDQLPFAPYLSLEFSSN